MALEVEHNGFNLHYNDNEDAWACWQLKLEDKSLAKLKQKVNKFIANRIKTANLIVGIADGAWSGAVPKMKQVVSRDAGTGEFWVADLDGGRRERKKPSELFPWTPEVDEGIAKYREIQARGQALIREANQVLTDIKKADQQQIEAMLFGLAKAPVEE